MDATKCNCGAVTVIIEGESYSMTHNEFRKRFPSERCQLERTMSNCNYCVNHWGIDLCGCGSGQKYGKCKEKLRECRHVAQDISAGVTKCHCENGWGAQ
jgi:hypothetical protein